MELERAMRADYVARLEKQLDAVETRAKEAEADAKQARNALTEALLEKARDQKSAKDRGGVTSSSTQGELEALRAELEAARRDMMRHESLVEDVREATARELRDEYEQKFHAARERMALEFQRRFADAQNELAADKNGAADPAETGATFSLTTKQGAATVAKDVSTGGKRRLVYAMVVTAFAGGFTLGWSTLPGKEKEIVVEHKAPVAIEPAPAEPMAAMTDSPPAATALQPIVVPAPSDETPAAAPETSRAGNEPAAPPHPDVTQLIEAYREVQARNAALSQQLDALQLRLDRASTRAGAAESALKVERARAAARSRHAGGDSGQGNQTRDTTPVAQQLTTPDPVSRPDSQPRGAAPPYPMVE